jgi:hypothetical protein
MYLLQTILNYLTYHWILISHYIYYTDQEQTKLVDIDQDHYST